MPPAQGSRYIPAIVRKCWTEIKLFIKLVMPFVTTIINIFAFAQLDLQKREKRMLANWRLLTRSLLIRERLKKRYDTEVSVESNISLYFQI